MNLQNAGICIRRSVFFRNISVTFTPFLSFLSLLPVSWPISPHFRWLHAQGITASQAEKSNWQKRSRLARVSPYICVANLSKVSNSFPSGWHQLTFGKGPTFVMFVQGLVCYVLTQGAEMVGIRSRNLAICVPQKPPWGQTVSRVRDLNGVIVSIVSPLKPPKSKECLCRSIVRENGGRNYLAHLKFESAPPRSLTKGSCATTGRDAFFCFVVRPVFGDDDLNDPALKYRIAGLRANCDLARADGSEAGKTLGRKLGCCAIHLYLCAVRRFDDIRLA